MGFAHPTILGEPNVHKYSFLVMLGLGWCPTQTQALTATHYYLVPVARCGPKGPAWNTARSPCSTGLLEQCSSCQAVLRALQGSSTAGSPPALYQAPRPCRA